MLRRMLSVIALVLALIFPTPKVAIRLATIYIGRPELADELLRVCTRESGCGRWGRVGIHSRDASMGRQAWRAAVRRGWLDPVRCVEHRGGPPWGRWSTRGILGIRAAWAVHHLAPEYGPCPAPELLDRPFAAALAGARWAAGCRTVQIWRGRRILVANCTCRDRVRQWMGAGVWASRTEAERERAFRRQCCDPEGSTNNINDYKNKGKALSRLRRSARSDTPGSAPGCEMGAVPKLPQRQDAQSASQALGADRREPQARELPFLHERTDPTGHTHAPAVRKLRGGTGAGAPRRLQRSSPGPLALPALPSSTP